jgi:hypothetical protein
VSTTQPEPADLPSREQQAREIYRLRRPVLLWWAWLAFALINVTDLAIQWHHRTALVYGAFLALGTGLAYAFALRPRVIADEVGITAVNPFRSCTVPWTAITSVDVGAAVQVHYSLPDGIEKMVPCWGLSASSRGQLRVDMRARRRAAQVSRLVPWQTPVPAGTRDMTARAEMQFVARQIAERAERARADGAATAQLTAVWAWESVAAIAAPAITLVTFLLT